MFNPETATAIDENALAIPIACNKSANCSRWFDNSPIWVRRRNAHEDEPEKKLLQAILPVWAHEDEPEKKLLAILAVKVPLQPVRRGMKRQGTGPAEGEPGKKKRRTVCSRAMIRPVKSIGVAALERTLAVT